MIYKIELCVNVGSMLTVGTSNPFLSCPPPHFLCPQSLVTHIIYMYLVGYIECSELLLLSQDDK